MACKLAAASALATVGMAIIGPGTGDRVALYQDALDHHNDYDSNFIVQQFSGANFPHAMGTCNPDSLIPQNYWIFQCVNDTHARRHTFTKDTCDADKWAGTVTLTNEGIDDRNENWFYCGGCDGYYAEVEFAAGTCDAPKKSVLSGALNSCADLGDGNKSLSIWCEGDHTSTPLKAEMQYFFAQNCSDRTSWLYSYYTEEVCSFLFEFETAEQAAIDVVANILHCRLGLDVATWDQWSGVGYEFMYLPNTTTKQHRMCNNGTFPPTESPTPSPTPQAAAAGFSLAVVAALAVAAAAQL